VRAALLGSAPPAPLTLADAGGEVAGAPPAGGAPSAGALTSTLPDCFGRHHR
jgi:hypothetical protein